jgi:hypothetical protein
VREEKKKPLQHPLVSKYYIFIIFIQQQELNQPLCEKLICDSKKYFNYFFHNIVFIIHTFDLFFYTPWQGGSKGGDKGGVTFMQEIPILVQNFLTPSI